MSQHSREVSKGKFPSGQEATFPASGVLFSFVADISVTEDSAGLICGQWCTLLRWYIILYNIN